MGVHNACTWVEMKMESSNYLEEGLFVCAQNNRL